MTTGESTWSWSRAFGLACSAGQFLLSAGAKGKRFALPHARILMHLGSAGIGGSAVDIEVQADDLRHTVDTVLGLIAEDAGQPVGRIFDDLRTTTGIRPPRPAITASSTRSSDRSARLCLRENTGSACRAAHE